MKGETFGLLRVLASPGSAGAPDTGTKGGRDDRSGARSGGTGDPDIASMAPAHHHDSTRNRTARNERAA